MHMQGEGAAYALEREKKTIWFCTANALIYDRFRAFLHIRLNAVIMPKNNCEMEIFFLFEEISLKWARFLLST